MKLQRKCPKCSSDINYSNSSNYNRGIKNNSLCYYCANDTRKGRKRTIEQRNLISEKTKEAMSKPEIKKRFLDSYTLENIEKRSKSTKLQMKHLKKDKEKYNRWINLQENKMKNYWNTMNNDRRNFHLLSLENGRQIFHTKFKNDKKFRQKFIEKYMKGKNNPFYGHHHTQETVEILRKKSSERLYNKLKNGEVKNFNTIPELLVQKKLKENGVDFETHFLLEYKIYDIFVPKYNALIEIDGTFWHSKGIDYKNMNKHQKRRYLNDINKNNIAAKNGYKIIRIWSDEIDKFNPNEVFHER